MLGVKLCEQYGLKLLWMGCRHHISELIMKAVWELKFGVTRSKEKEDMKKFKKDYLDMIDRTKKMKTLPNLQQIGQDLPLPFLLAKKEEISSRNNENSHL